MEQTTMLNHAQVATTVLRGPSHQQLSLAQLALIAAMEPSAEIQVTVVGLDARLAHLELSAHKELRLHTPAHLGTSVAALT